MTGDQGFTRDCLQACAAGKKTASLVQSEPPTVPVWDLFPGGIFPEGEWQSYKDEYVPQFASWSSYPPVSLLSQYKILDIKYPLKYLLLLRIFCLMLSITSMSLVPHFWYYVSSLLAWFSIIVWHVNNAQNDWMIAPIAVQTLTSRSPKGTTQFGYGYPSAGISHFW